MPDIIKTLLGAGITFGLSDRETFVKELAVVIEEYQRNPQKAQKWAKAVVDYLEGVRDNINMQQAMKSAVGEAPLPDKEQVEKLTHAIEELTKQLQQGKK
jgi:hypothetical protein